MSLDKQYVVQHPRRLLLDGDGSLFLQLTSSGDVEQFYNLVHQNRAHLSRYQRWARDINFEQMHQAVQASVARIAEDSWLQYRIMVPHAGVDHRMIGTVTLFGRDVLQGTAILGYWLAEAEQGKSHARKAVQCLLRYAVPVWRLNAVYIQIDDDNERSRGLATRLGAVPTSEIVEEIFNDEVFPMRRWKLVCTG